MDGNYVGFIPCRSGSERVKNKNTRPFAGFQGGLLELKLLQMSKVESFSKILVSSDDAVVLDYAEEFSNLNDSRVVALPRPKHLALSSTTMDDFILYIANLESDATIVWTHVTSPFLRSGHYNSAIGAYEKSKSLGKDSLVSVSKIQKFLWDDNGPINYDPKVLKWPRSQDIKPLYEINHGMYIMPFSLMRERQDRIGFAPMFHEIDDRDALDIDWEEQFHLLESFANIRASKGEKLAD